MPLEVIDTIEVMVAIGIGRGICFLYWGIMKIATPSWGGVGGFEKPCHVASDGAHGL